MEEAIPKKGSKGGQKAPFYSVFREILGVYLGKSDF